MGTLLTNRIKTWTFMALLGGLLIAVGGLLGGTAGLVMAFVVALGLNGLMYWKSDALALRANGARPLAEDELPHIRWMVEELARRASIPAPRIYVIDRPELNAFATGRSPRHGAIAFTTGLLTGLDDRQLAGVTAHELSHIANRDTLVSTVAATIGGTISFLAQMAQFQLLFGGSDDEQGNPIGALAAMILAPIAALLIQLAVSRSREYLADASGATLTGDPEGLAQALEQIHWATDRAGSRGLFGRSRPAGRPELNPAFSHLYFVHPLAGTDVARLFATHPPLEERVARLRATVPSRRRAAQGTSRD